MPRLAAIHPSAEAQSRHLSGSITLASLDVSIRILTSRYGRYRSVRQEVPGLSIPIVIIGRIASYVQLATGKDEGRAGPHRLDDHDVPIRWRIGERNQ